MNDEPLPDERLTKLEYVALQIMCSQPHSPMIRFAFDRAEEFLNEARRRRGEVTPPAFTTRQFETP
jgi:hypothetical protein